MEEQVDFISRLLIHLVGPLIVGVVVLLGQSFIAPKVARGVKKGESILEQMFPLNISQHKSHQASLRLTRHMHFSHFIVLMAQLRTSLEKWLRLEAYHNKTLLISSWR
jgi:hypothetical protein